MRGIERYPQGFPIFPGEDITPSIQGRLYIPGDQNLGKEGPEKVFGFGIEILGVKVPAGTPIADRKTRSVADLFWTLRHYKANEEALGAMRMLKKVEPNEPMWARLARENQRTATKLHKKILYQIAALESLE